jgi:hypothetical protein
MQMLHPVRAQIEQGRFAIVRFMAVSQKANEVADAPGCRWIGHGLERSSHRGG